jgi:hypothetical protein
MSLIGGDAAAWPLPLYANGRKGPNYLVLLVGDHDAAIVTSGWKSWATAMARTRFSTPALPKDNWSACLN